MGTHFNRGILFSALLTLAPSSFATIVSTTGNATPIPRPADARTGALVSDTQAFVWAEAQNYTLAAPLAVDLVNPGTYKLTNLSTSTLPAGTHVNSYYFSFDTPSDQPGAAVGSVTFDQPIIAIIARNSPETHLQDSNFLGLGTLFTTGELYSGLDGGEPITLSADRRTFSYDLTVTSPGDHFRILTQIPEPSSLLPAAPALLLFRMRRKYMSRCI